MNWSSASWDCVILDECHHVTAETIEAIVGEFNCQVPLRRLSHDGSPG